MGNGESSYRRFLSGDKEGLAEIIRMYSDDLTFYINSIVHDWESAEEIADDTFVKLYVKKPRFSGKSSFKTWLYSIGRHTAVDHLRKMPRLVNVTGDEFASVPSDEDIEEKFDRSEERMALHKAINSLKSEYSQVLYLVSIEGFSNSEAAKIMKKSDKQIRDLLSNAKKALRVKLEREEVEREKL